jgi:hypothetical protein
MEFSLILFGQLFGSNHYFDSSLTAMRTNQGDRFSCGNISIYVLINSRYRLFYNTHPAKFSIIFTTPLLHLHPLNMNHTPTSTSPDSGHIVVARPFYFNLHGLPT